MPNRMRAYLPKSCVAGMSDMPSHWPGSFDPTSMTLTRIAALSSVLGEPVNRALIRRALEDPVAGGGSTGPRDPEPGSPSVPAIQGAVCSILGISQQAMLSPSRASEVSRARQMAMYLSRELTDLSLAEIARQFDRDHTTILHACHKVEKGLETDRVIREAVEAIQNLL